MRPNFTARSSPSYLLHTPYSYYFRIKIPEDLRLQFNGKTEIKRSLQTGYLSEAKFKARVLAGQFQRFFRYLRGKDGNIMATKLTDDLLSDITSKFTQDWLDRHEDQKLEEKKRPLSEKEIDNISSMYWEIGYDSKVALATGDYDFIRRGAEDALEEQGVNDLGNYKYEFQLEDEKGNLINTFTIYLEVLP